MTTTAATEATRTPSARYTGEEGGLPGGDGIATSPSFSPCESNASYLTTWPTSPE